MSQIKFKVFNHRRNLKFQKNQLLLKGSQELRVTLAQAMPSLTRCTPEGPEHGRQRLGLVTGSFESPRHGKP